MQHPGGDYFAGLATAPIFDTGTYLSEALLLPVNENEDDLDAQLAVSAQESGIDNPHQYLSPEEHDVSTAMSTMTASTEHRSSMSIHSRETQSTGYTSHPSRTSRDNPYVDMSPALRTPPAPPRASLSRASSTSVIGRLRPSTRHRHSSSTFSAAKSALSDSSPAFKPTSRRHKRASALFAMFRKDSSTCPLRSQTAHLSKPPSPKLDCGHSVSQIAIRIDMRQSAQDTSEIVAPTCCGQPLPPEILESVVTKVDVDSANNSAVQSPELSSLRDSGYSEDGMSAIDLPKALATRSHRPDSLVAAPDTPSEDTTLQDYTDINLALANEAFKSLSAERQEQFQRISAFESNQRKALSAYYQCSFRRLASQLETTKGERTKQHALDVERLEESQIVQEHDLRKDQARETQNMATAIKHMEAYCSGPTTPSSASPDCGYTVTEEDRRKLERQRLAQQKLPAKHESAINVLRAKQEREIKTRLQKQSAELKQLDGDYEREKRVEELKYSKDSSRLEATIQERRRRVMHRWILKFEIWRRDWEGQHGQPLDARLPHDNWPDSTESDGPISPSSALAVCLPLVE